MREAIDGLLRQPIDTSLPFDAVVEHLVSLAAQCQAKIQAPPPTVPAPAVVGAGAPPPIAVT
jgi:hypothetical protein